MSKKKLCKSRKNKMIGGVCGGLAEYLNMDPTIVRIIAGVLCLAKGIGILVYVVAYIVMPYPEDDFSDDDTDNLKSANIDPEENAKSERKSSGAKKDSRMHSDEEFDNFFNDKN